MLLLAIIFLLSACGAPAASETAILNEMMAITNCFNEPEQSLYMHNTDSIDEMHIHWDDGITQFGSRIEGSNRVLYEIKNHGMELVQLAVFSSLNVEWGHAETKWCRPQSIFYLDVIDNWVILSAGEFQGSGNNFFGDLYRVNRDGSGREAFRLGSMNDSFIIINGWVYHHIWCAQALYGWIRIRPDGTDREFVGDTINTIIYLNDEITSAYQGYELEHVTKIEWKVIFYEYEDYNDHFFLLYLLVNGETGYYAGSGFAPRSQLVVNCITLRLDAPASALSTLSSLWTGLSQQFYIYQTNDTELAVMSRFVDFMSDDTVEYEKILVIPIEEGTQILVSESAIVLEQTSANIYE